MAEEGKPAKQTKKQWSDIYKKKESIITKAKEINNLKTVLCGQHYQT